MTAAEKEYGGALYDLAVEEHCEDAVLEGFALAVDAFEQTPEYLKLVQNPAVPLAERLTLLDEAFSGAHEYVRSLLKILCEKSALGIASGCLQEYRARFNAARGILPVEAITAVPLDEAQKKALCEKLLGQLGGTVRSIQLKNVVDPSVMGGVRLRYEGKELDGTAAGRLAALRRILTQA